MSRRGSAAILVGMTSAVIMGGLEPTRIGHERYRDVMRLFVGSPTAASALPA